MKVSIAAAILILLVAALMGVPNHQRLSSIRESHAKLVATAAQLGISTDPSHPDHHVRITKRDRENKEADAKLAAVEFIAYAKEMEAMKKNGGPPDQAQQKRIMEIMDRMMSLDSTQLKILIAELRAAKDLKDETRQGLIGFSIMTLSNDHPQAALALVTESSDILEKNVMLNAHVVSSSLAKWAKEDPMAALEWVKKNSAKFPDLITDETKRGLISGTAKQDPKLAFKLIAELGIKEPQQAISNMVRAAKTPEERTTTLIALREHLATLTDEKTKNELSKEAVENFAYSIAKEGFDSSTRWIAESNFTAAEIESFVQGIYVSEGSDENGKWVVWIGDHLPPEKADDRISIIVGNWTRNDYQAAGKWLATVADGPTKNTAIRSYAETIAQYEPATAAQWALTLPPGKDRDSTLNRIYRNWPESDSAAKEAFKQEHGIK
jgi:hypothetical protein